MTRWLKTQKNTLKLELYYFGSSTGAAAALKASLKLPEIKAIVSRGGQPVFVMVDLVKVTAPTLLVVGGLDDEVDEIK